MPSNLYRLFRYARAEKMDTTENFATEALAAAIRHDPAPVLSVLPGVATRVIDATTQVAAYTQVFFAGAGRVDLVLEIRTGGHLSTVWIEVKVEAGEHGDQLANYQRHASDHGIQLITLGRVRLRPDIDHLTWSDVRRAALHCKGAGAPFWEDLALFLEDIKMADGFDGAVSATELDSLGGSYRLFRKMAHVLEPVGLHGRKAWPESAWPAGEAVRKQIADQFARYGRLTIFGERRTLRVSLVAGLLPPDPHHAQGSLYVNVEARPKDLSARSALTSQLSSSLVPPRWEWPHGGHAIVAARQAVPANGEQETLTAWFIGRLDELAGAGAFTTLAEMAKAPPAPIEPDDPDQLA